MIKFDRGISPETTFDLERTKAFQDIKPEEDTSMREANDFWDTTFNDEPEYELSEEEIIDNIFGVDEDSFDFDIQNPISAELAEKFTDSRWSELSGREKMSSVEELRDALAKELQLSRNPEINYFEGPSCDCGSFNHSTGKVEINRVLLDSPNKLVNTVAHEMRHAYQHERAEKLETFTDLLYNVNFVNYIEPLQLSDNTFLFYRDYCDQFVEAEARAYAKAFTEAGWKNE